MPVIDLDTASLAGSDDFAGAEDAAGEEPAARPDIMTLQLGDDQPELPPPTARPFSPLSPTEPGRTRYDELKSDTILVSHVIGAGMGSESLRAWLAAYVRISEHQLGMATELLPEDAAFVEFLEAHPAVFRPEKRPMESPPSEEKEPAKRACLLPTPPAPIITAEAMKPKQGSTAPMPWATPLPDFKGKRVVARDLFYVPPQPPAAQGVGAEEEPARKEAPATAGPSRVKPPTAQQEEDIIIVTKAPDTAELARPAVKPPATKQREAPTAPSPAHREVDRAQQPTTTRAAASAPPTGATTFAATVAKPAPLQGTKPAEQEAQREPEQQQQATTKKAPRYPTIVAPVLPNWFRVLEGITKDLGETPNSKAMGSGIRFMPNSEREYRIVERHLTALEQTGVTMEWHIYQLEADKKMKVALRGLPAGTPTDWIAAACKDLGFPVEYVKQINAREGRGGCVYFVQLSGPPKENIQMYQIRELLRMPHIKVEAWKGKKGPAQCHRCQGFRHHSQGCHRPQKCVRCAGPHRAKECPRPRTEPGTCSNCAGAHTANDTKCPVFRREARNAKAGTAAHTVPSRPGPVTKATERKPTVEESAPGTLMASANAPTQRGATAKPSSNKTSKPKKKKKKKATQAPGGAAQSSSKPSKTNEGPKEAQENEQDIASLIATLLTAAAQQGPQAVQEALKKTALSNQRAQK